MKKEINISDSALVIEFQKGNKKVLPVLVKRWHLFAYLWCLC